MVVDSVTDAPVSTLAAELVTAVMLVEARVML